MNFKYKCPREIELMGVLNHKYLSPVRFFLHECSSFASVTAFLLVPGTRTGLDLDAEGDRVSPWCSTTGFTKRDMSKMEVCKPAKQVKQQGTLHGVCSGVGKGTRVSGSSTCAE